MVIFGNFLLERRRERWDVCCNSWVLGEKAPPKDTLKRVGVPLELARIWAVKSFIVCFFFSSLIPSLRIKGRMTSG